LLIRLKTNIDVIAK